MPIKLPNPPVPVDPDICDLSMSFMIVVEADETASCLLPPAAAPPFESKS